MNGMRREPSSDSGDPSTTQQGQQEPMVPGNSILISSSSSSDCGYDSNGDSSTSSAESIATCLCVPYEDPWDDRATYRIRDLDMPLVQSSWKRLLQVSNSNKKKNRGSRRQRPRHLHLESKSLLLPASPLLTSATSVVKHLIQLQQLRAPDEKEELASLTHESEGGEASATFLTQLVKCCREGNLHSMSVKLSNEDQDENLEEGHHDEMEDVLATVLKYSNCLRCLSSLSLTGFEGRQVMELLLDQLILDPSGNACHLRSLDLKRFGANNISLLIPFLESYSGLGELFISQTDLETGHVFPNLAQSLSQPSCCLTRLSLSSANLTADASLVYVAQILAHQPDLVALDLSGNTNLLETVELIVPDIDDDDDSDQEDEFSMIEYRRKPVGMDAFCTALAHHSSIQELNMKDCSMSNDSWACLLTALGKNTSLRKVWGCMRRVRIADETLSSVAAPWVHELGNLSKNLTALYGLRTLTAQPEWTTLVVPALRRNTSLVDIDDMENLSSSIEVAQGSPALAKVVAQTGAFFLDTPTKQILTRNKYLAIMAEQKCMVEGNPTLPVWPRLLERLAAPSVEGSAVYSFLRGKSSNLFYQQAKSVSSSRKRNSCHDDNGKQNDRRDLLHRLWLMEEENKRLRQENTRLKQDNVMKDH